MKSPATFTCLLASKNSFAIITMEPLLQRCYTMYIYFVKWEKRMNHMNRSVGKYVEKENNYIILFLYLHINHHYFLINSRRYTYICTFFIQCLSTVGHRISLNF